MRRFFIALIAIVSLGLSASLDTHFWITTLFSVSSGVIAFWAITKISKSSGAHILFLIFLLIIGGGLIAWIDYSMSLKNDFLLCVSGTTFASYVFSVVVWIADSVSERIPADEFEEI